MFNNTRKVLDEFEETYNNLCCSGCLPRKEEEDILLYFNMHLSKALMQDEYILHALDLSY